eukprot:870877-Amphidinium_carterae.1
MAVAAHAKKRSSRAGSDKICNDGSDSRSHSGTHETRTLECKTQSRLEFQSRLANGDCKSFAGKPLHPHDAGMHRTAPESAFEPTLQPK